MLDSTGRMETKTLKSENVLKFKGSSQDLLVLISLSDTINEAEKAYVSFWISLSPDIQKVYKGTFKCFKTDDIGKDLDPELFNWLNAVSGTFLKDDDSDIIKRAKDLLESLISHQKQLSSNHLKEIYELKKSLNKNFLACSLKECTYRAMRCVIDI